MRRSQNEITDRQEILDIIQECDVIRVGMSVDDVPYIVPMNFGYDKDVFYFHGAREGRKIDMIHKNPKVCFEMDKDHRLIGDSDRACDWTMKYSCVMGTGTMAIVEEWDEKRKALNLLMAHYGGKDHYEYKDAMLERIGILKLTVESMTGKKSS